MNKTIFREHYRGFAVSVFWQRPCDHSAPLTYGYCIEDELEVWGYGFLYMKAACRAAGTVIDEVHVPLLRDDVIRSKKTKKTL
jgi:hypothetical protein